MVNIYKAYVIRKLHEKQYAYMSSQGIADAIVKAIDDWTLELDQNGTIGIQAILREFSKAFDRMQPEIRAHKLVDMSIHLGLVALFRM